MKKRKVVIVMPALNASSTLERTVQDIPEDLRRSIILVDDRSTDDTVKIAKRLGITVFRHSRTKGYGGNQKTCYKQALKQNPDIVVMIHPDYQYDSTLTHELIRPIIEGRYDVMLGSRIRTRAESLAGGMPVYKYFSNRALTLIENIVLGLNLTEFHTGFRAYNKEVLKMLPFKNFSDDFVFDQHMLISAAHSGLRIGEIPVPVRYFPEASSINFRKSIKYGVEILWALCLYILAKTAIFRSPMFTP